MNDKAASPAKSSDLGVKTIDMLRNSESKLWGASIYEHIDKRYIKIVDKVADVATYYRVGNDDEITFAGDGKPMSYIAERLVIDRSIKGSTVVAAGTDEEEIRSKIDMLRAAFDLVYPGIQLYRSRDELNKGEMRFTLQYLNWGMEVRDMIPLLDKVEETFTNPAMPVGTGTVHDSAELMRNASGMGEIPHRGFPL